MQTPEEAAEVARQRHLAAQAIREHSARHEPASKERRIAGVVFEEQASVKSATIETKGIDDASAHIIEAVWGTGEPIFVLRAQDLFSIMTLVDYQERLEKFGPSDVSMQADLVDVINRFKEWQKANAPKVRYPD